MTEEYIFEVVETYDYEDCVDVNEKHLEFVICFAKSLGFAEVICHTLREKYGSRVRDYHIRVSRN